VTTGKHRLRDESKHLSKELKVDLKELLDGKE
jgi:hypothetical protein